MMSFINKNILKREEVTFKEEPVHIDDRVVAKRDVYKEESYKKAKLSINEEVEEFKVREMKKVKKEIEKYKKEEVDEINRKAEEACYNRVYEELDELYEKSYQDKINQANDIIKKANEQKSKVEEGISEKRRTWMKENEEDIIKILTESTKKIIGETMQVNSETVSNLLRETIKEVDDHSKKIWVSVSEEANKALIKEEYVDHNIQIIVDPSLKNLEMIIKSDERLIDGTIRSKLERLEELLEEWLDESGPYSRKQQ